MGDLLHLTNLNQGRMARKIITQNRHVAGKYHYFLGALGKNDISFGSFSLHDNRKSNRFII